LWDDESPPWDSSAAKNRDNDYETNIRIMTKSDFEKEQADDQAFPEKTRSVKTIENKVELGVLAAQVQAAGRVFYSYPAEYQHFDIPAELEVKMEKHEREQQEQQHQQQATTTATAAAGSSIEISANIASVKTLMFRCGKAWADAFLVPNLTTRRVNDFRRVAVVVVTN
jgi:hypothetical protein